MLVTRVRMFVVERHVHVLNVLVLLVAIVMMMMAMVRVDGVRMMMLVMMMTVDDYVSNFVILWEKRCRDEEFSYICLVVGLFQQRFSTASTVSDHWSV